MEYQVDNYTLPFSISGIIHNKKSFNDFLTVKRVKDLF